MSGVDNRIVSMQFDNASFQQKLGTTIESLAKLKDSLNFDNAKQGLANLSTAGKNFNMGEMGASVDGISAKFIGLAAVGITALANITNRAVDAGIQLTKSLTVSPIAQGFAEFELKMGSIQTIMAGSGASLEVVNEKLQKLNEYSDKTIYSFGDMTSNIGKFTNAGVNLDKSVAAIQGIANVAALSGANAEEASRAMYNFAQSISSGSVKLMDWKSIELANMATVEFKQQLIDSAVAAGTLTKAGEGWKTAAGSMVTPTKGFNESLSDAWLTSEALTTTLGRYSDATTDIGKRATAAAQDVKTFSQMISTMKESVGSGWSQTFESIFGDFEEGKKLWTNINNAFSGAVGKAAADRNDMFGRWNDFGARDTFITALGQGLKYLGDIIKPVGEAFREIFPKKTAEDLIIWTRGFADFTAKLKIGGDTSKAIKTAFKSFFAILDIGWEIFKGITKVVFALAGGIWKLISPILKLMAAGTGVIGTFHDIVIGGGGLEAFFAGITNFIDIAVAAILQFGSAIGNVLSKFAPLFEAGYNALKSFAGEVVDFFSGLGPLLLKPFEALQKLTGAIADFGDSLSFGSGSDKNGVEKTAEDLDKSASLASRFLDALMNVFGQIGNAFDGIIDGIAGAFKGLGTAIGKALGSGNFDQVFDILKVGLLGGILVYIRKFFKEGLKLDFGQGKIFEKVRDMLDVVTGSLKSLQANVRADTLQKIAISMGILAIAIIALSLVDAAALGKAMAAIAAGFVQLTAVMLVLEKSSGGGGSIKIIAMAASFVLLATAMALLVIPIKVLSTMNMAELAKGLAGVSVAMLVMAKAVSMIGSDTGGLIRAGASMILISLALILLARAIKKFSDMNIVDMALGLGAAAVGIRLMMAALDSMPDDMEKQGFGLILLVLALNGLARVVKIFAGMALATLAVGFLSIATGLQMIGVAMRSMPDDMMEKAAALIIVSGALFIIGKVVEQIGGLDILTLIKGIGAMGIMLGILAVAINAMSGAQSGVGALIAAAAGLYILGKVLKEVGSIPFGDLLKGIAGIAALLLVLGAASLLAPGLLVLGAALLAIGLGFAFIGAGAALAGKGFELMAKFGGEGMKHITAALQEFIRQMPQFVSAFVEGLIQAAVEIANQGPVLVESIVKLLDSILDAVIKSVPKIAEALSVIITTFLELVQEKVPEFVATGFAILMAFLQGLRDNIGEIVTTVADIVIAFIDAFSEKVPELVDSLFDLFLEVLTTLAFELGESATAFIAVGKALIDGFISGLEQNVGPLLTWFTELPGKILDIIKSAFGIQSPSTKFIDIGKNLLQGLLDGVVNGAIAVKNWFLEIGGKVLGWIGDVSKKLLNKGVDLIQGIWSGITQRIADVTSWFKNLGGLVVSWIGDMGSKLVDIGSDLVRGLWNGIKAMKEWVMEKVKGFAGSVLDGIKGFFGISSPSKEFAKIGVHLGEGLIVGIDKMAPSVTNASKELSKAVLDGFGGPTLTVGVPNVLQDMGHLNPTITPVLDLSMVQAESKNLAGLLGVSAISPNASYSAARLISTTEDTTGTNDSLSDNTPTEINFEQNIYSPTALSTNDIYRNTKSQIALAKEELSIA